MARDRIQLHEILVEILGSRDVYFQPPESMKLDYPCIVYERSRIDSRKANNHTYLKYNQYTVTVIDEDPDTEIPDRLFELENCRHDRRFVSDDLYHDVFTLYF